ncbi:MAG: hypothetical protein ABII18_06465 [bacterium]
MKREKTNILIQSLANSFMSDDYFTTKPVVNEYATKQEIVILILFARLLRVIIFIAGFIVVSFVMGVPFYLIARLLEAWS